MTETDKKLGIELDEAIKKAEKLKSLLTEVRELLRKVEPAKPEIVFKVPNYPGWQAIKDTVSRVKTEYGDGSCILRMEFSKLKCLTDEEFNDIYSQSSTETH